MQNSKPVLKSIKKNRALSYVQSLRHQPRIKVTKGQAKKESLLLRDKPSFLFAASEDERDLFFFCRPLSIRELCQASTQKEDLWTLSKK